MGKTTMKGMNGGEVGRGKRGPSQGHLSSAVFRAELGHLEAQPFSVSYSIWTLNWALPGRPIKHHGSSQLGEESKTTSPPFRFLFRSSFLEVLAEKLAKT